MSIAATTGPTAPKRWVEKVGRSIKGSDTPQLAGPVRAARRGPPEERHGRPVPVPALRPRPLRDEHGTARWSRTFHSVDEARGWQADQKRAMNLRRSHVARSCSVNSRDQWHAAALAGEVGQRRTRKPYAHGTLVGYRNDLNKFILPVMGDRNGGKLTAVDWQFGSKAYGGKG